MNITLGDLYACIRNENTRILLLDDMELICIAPMKSPVFKPYLGRIITFVELPTDANKDVVCGAELIIILENEK